MTSASFTALIRSSWLWGGWSIESLPPRAARVGQRSEAVRICTTHVRASKLAIALDMFHQAHGAPGLAAIRIIIIAHEPMDIGAIWLRQGADSSTSDRVDQIIMPAGRMIDTLTPAARRAPLKAA